MDGWIHSLCHLLTSDTCALMILKRIVFLPFPILQHIQLHTMFFYKPNCPLLLIHYKSLQIFMSAEAIQPPAQVQLKAHIPMKTPAFGPNLHTGLLGQHSSRI